MLHKVLARLSDHTMISITFTTHTNYNSLQSNTFLQAATVQERHRLTRELLLVRFKSHFVLGQDVGAVKVECDSAESHRFTLGA